MNLEPARGARSARTAPRILVSAEDIEVVGEAENGAQALEGVAAHRPDIVLMDVRMPVMDGLTAAKAITERPQRPGPRRRVRAAGCP